MSTQALPQTPVEQLYTMTEAPTPYNSASAYPAELSHGQCFLARIEHISSHGADGIDHMTADMVESKKRDYARKLYKYTKSMAGPAGVEEETKT